MQLEVEIWPFCACAMHPAMITGTVRSTQRISSSEMLLESLVVL